MSALALVSIGYPRQDHIVTITINRPESRNSLDKQGFFAGLTGD
ncbi:hypothetical protein [Mycobacterium intermedium]|nr:hypothetical protein [Mycobacterium intermedium]